MYYTIDIIYFYYIIHYSSYCVYKTAHLRVTYFKEISVAKFIFVLFTPSFY